MLPLHIDRDAPEPLYQQIKRHITQQIEDGILTGGDRLPPTREFAEELGVARISVVTAYEELKDEGLLISHVGRGTFVAEQPVSAIMSGALAGTRRATAHALRDLLRLAGRPGVINFSVGTPAEDFLPVELIREAINEVLVRDGANAIAYEAPEGYGPLRETIARRLGVQGIEVPAGDVLITGGCQQALDLAVQGLLNPGDVMLTGNPTYSGILDIAHARGVTPIGVPVDDYGMCTDQMESLINEHRPRLIYVAPTYHNPTGTVMPLRRRRQLLDLAARYHLPVLEDGVYDPLNYADEPPPPLKALDENDMVLYASSFSKVLLPGMRIGYLVVGGQLYQRLARVKHAADVCTPALNQRAMHKAMQNGLLWDHIGQVRAVCRVRREAMINALAHYLPGARFTPPEGGLYLWVALPTDGPTSHELYLHAVQNGVAFAPGPLFYTDDSGAHHLRLNIAAYPPEIIEEGIRRLGKTWDDLAAGYAAPQVSNTMPFV